MWTYAKVLANILTQILVLLDFDCPTVPTLVLRLLRRNWSWCLSLFALLATTAFGQTQLPTDIELHAAYCIPVIQNDIKGLKSARDDLQKMLDSPAVHDAPPEVLGLLRKQQNELPQTIAERQSILNRLQLFLLPRIQYLDASALLAATSRAKPDMDDWSRLADKCIRECAQPQERITEACLRKCQRGPLEDRLTTCRNPTWLPF